MIDLDKPCEGIHYNIVPLAVGGHDQAWQVLVLRGQYKDYNLVFTSIEYNGKTRELRFKLDTLVDNEFIAADEDLQQYAVSVLTDIVLNGIVDGSLMINDKDSSN